MNGFPVKTTEVLHNRRQGGGRNLHNYEHENKNKACLFERFLLAFHGVKYFESQYTGG